MATRNEASISKSAGIMSKPRKPELAEIVPPLLAWFRKHQYHIVVDPETAPYAVAWTRTRAFGPASGATDDGGVI